MISKQKKEVKKFIQTRLSKNKNVYFYGDNYKINKIHNNKFEFQFIKKKSMINLPKLNGLFQIENASVALAFSQIMNQ